MILKGEFGWGIAEGKIWRLRLLPFLRKQSGSAFSSKTLVTYSLAFREQAPGMARSFHNKPDSRVRGNDLNEQVLKEAFSRLVEELKREKKRLKKGKEFLDFPLSVLQDPQLWNSVREFLGQGVQPGQAVMKAFRKWEKALGKLDDSYLRLRIQDLEDLRHRILAMLVDQQSECVPDYPFIAVGKDLYVTDLLRLQRTKLAGIALEEGNESAHGVMLAKALGIPMVGKVKGLLANAREGELAILSRDKVYIDEKPKRGQSPFSAVPIEKKKPGCVPNFLTKDKVAITVRANVQLPEEIDEAKAAGAIGVGLFRTEFLWMKQGLTLKDETEIYRRTLDAFDPDPVIFRLADLGSDKPYEKIKWPEEKNPALGWRGLRFLLDRPEILSRQLQALCSAAGTRTLHILLPMVRTLEEVRDFLETLKPVQRKHKTKVKLGIMIETPSSADLIDHLPREVSFVSLGTNDLLQYFFAVDRMHPTLKANFLHPAFVRFLNEIARKCARAKKSVSICGEMAANPKALPVLLGLGLREFSLSIPKIPEVAKELARISMRKPRRHVAKILRD